MFIPSRYNNKASAIMTRHATLLVRVGANKKHSDVNAPTITTKLRCRVFNAPDSNMDLEPHFLIACRPALNNTKQIKANQFFVVSVLYSGSINKMAVF